MWLLMKLFFSLHKLVLTETFHRTLGIPFSLTKILKGLGVNVFVCLFYFWNFVVASDLWLGLCKTNIFQNENKEFIRQGVNGPFMFLSAIQTAYSQDLS